MHDKIKPSNSTTSDGQTVFSRNQGPELQERHHRGVSMCRDQANEILKYNGSVNISITIE